MKKWLCLTLIASSITMNVPTFAQSESTTTSKNAEQASESKAVSVFEQEFATVDGELISVAMFREFYNYQNRNTYYHGKPPEGEEEKFAREQKDELIHLFVAANAARKLGLTADFSKLEADLDSTIDRNADNPKWPEVKDDYIAMYRTLYRNMALAKVYKKHIVDSVKLSEEDVISYFENNRDKFTQPPQNKLAVILIGVAPNATRFVWEAVREQVDEIHAKLVDGADFSELAMLHSTDITADQGGNMGLVHKGMISTEVEELIATMEVGDITPPVFILDGVAIFKLTGRNPATRHTYDEVKARARRLAVRDTTDSLWQDTRLALVESANVHINDEFK
ncbi:peptidylprolyl isomerase [Thalassotalea aquiviva]|uniref:peptidylprolyl isomerase n=1 Tax=Thalassotalea aquiviva TaxID=3242415 RepID=UPI00352A1FCB